MRRFVFMIFCAAVLSGCSRADIPVETSAKKTEHYTEETTVQYTEGSKPAETFKAPDEIRYVTLPQTEKSVFSGEEFTFEQVENMSDEELSAVIYGGLIKECEIPGTAPTDDWYY